MTFARSAWMCGYSNSTLHHYGWKKNQLTFQKGTFGERYDQRLFARACFGSAKLAPLTVVMLTGEEEGVAVVSFVKFVIPLGLKSARGGQEQHL